MPRRAARAGPRDSQRQARAPRAEETSTSCRTRLRPRSPVFVTSSVRVWVPPGAHDRGERPRAGAQETGRQGEVETHRRVGNDVGVLGQRRVEMGRRFWRSAANRCPRRGRVEPVCLTRCGDGGDRAVVSEVRHRGAVQPPARVRVADVADDGAARQDGTGEWADRDVVDLPPEPEEHPLVVKARLHSGVKTANDISAVWMPGPGTLVAGPCRRSSTSRRRRS